MFWSSPCLAEADQVHSHGQLHSSPPPGQELVCVWAGRDLQHLMHCMSSGQAAHLQQRCLFLLVQLVLAASFTAPAWLVLELCCLQVAILVLWLAASAASECD